MGKGSTAVLEHSRNVARLAGDFAEHFQAGTWGYCCGMMHDIGKHSQGLSAAFKGWSSGGSFHCGGKGTEPEKGAFMRWRHTARQDIMPVCRTEEERRTAQEQQAYRDG